VGLLATGDQHLIHAQLRRHLPPKRTFMHSSPPSLFFFLTLFLSRINLGSGFILSATAMSRLAHQTTCKIGGCGELFTSGDAYQVHVREDHLIMRGKSGSHRFPCPWEGCTEFKTKATLSNHLLGHNTRSGCNLCDVTMGVRSDSVQKHYRHCHKDTHANVSITSANRADYSYLFFTG